MSGKDNLRMKETRIITLESLILQQFLQLQQEQAILRQLQQKNK